MQSLRTAALLGAVVHVSAAGMIGCTTRADEQLIQVQEDLGHVFEAALRNGDLRIQLARDHLTIVITERLLFVGQGHDISPEGRDVLKEVGRLLKPSSFKEIRVAGHADKAVSDDSLTYFGKLELSKARATQTVRVLKENGLESHNVIIEWYGDIRPIARNETAEGRQMNRRVEIMVFTGSSRDASESVATKDKR